MRLNGAENIVFADDAEDNGMVGGEDMAVETGVSLSLCWAARM